MIRLVMQFRACHHNHTAQVGPYRVLGTLHSGMKGLKESPVEEGTLLYDQLTAIPARKHLLQNIPSRPPLNALQDELLAVRKYLYRIAGDECEVPGSEVFEEECEGVSVRFKDGNLLDVDWEQLEEEPTLNVNVWNKQSFDCQVSKVRHEPEHVEKAVED